MVLRGLQRLSAPPRTNQSRHGDGRRGSSGELRKTAGMLPPGHSACPRSERSAPLGEILGRDAGRRRRAPDGNLMLAALNGVNGGYLTAIRTLGSMSGAPAASCRRRSTTSICARRSRMASRSKENQRSRSVAGRSGAST